MLNNSRKGEEALAAIGQPAQLAIALVTLIRIGSRATPQVSCHVFDHDRIVPPNPSNIIDDETLILTRVWDADE
jgi:hypothetical protein